MNFKCGGRTQLGKRRGHTECRFEIFRRSGRGFGGALMKRLFGILWIVEARLERSKLRRGSQGVRPSPSLYPEPLSPQDEV